MLWLCLAGGNGDKNVKAAVNKNINNKVPYRAWLNWTGKGSFPCRPTEILISPAKSFPPFLPLSYVCSPERQCTLLLCDVTPFQPTPRASKLVSQWGRIMHFISLYNDFEKQPAAILFFLKCKRKIRTSPHIQMPLFLWYFVFCWTNAPVNSAKKHQQYLSTKKI